METYILLCKDVGKDLLWETSGDKRVYDMNQMAKKIVYNKFAFLFVQRLTMYFKKCLQSFLNGRVCIIRMPIEIQFSSIFSLDR